MQEQGINGRAVAIVSTAPVGAEPDQTPAKSYLVVDTTSAVSTDPDWKSQIGGLRQVFNDKEPTDTGLRGYILVEITTGQVNDPEAILQTKPSNRHKPTAITGFTQNAYPVSYTHLTLPTIYSV